MKIEAEIKFEIGQFVFLKTDPSQQEHLITGILIEPGTPKYRLAFVGYQAFHTEIEITGERNVLKAGGITPAEKN